MWALITGGLMFGMTVIFLWEKQAQGVKKQLAVIAKNCWLAVIAPRQNHQQQ
ncbi:hypothetical protein B481_1090 [Planococcus halocryophilus Or1]|uniref:hypothetical protein n=1 Tax=Planococcus halocryophilus TaxID=1215089 RepID=UPI0002B87EE8|nr:hypothetical protein [Planococcus halocryophilus]EMF47497.1 hypothetical protein B481_1090 [Planococcus halocryophilus Or1]